MSQSGKYTPDIVPGTYIEEILGDIGGVSGAVVEFNANPQAGATIFFSGTGTLMLLNVTDLNGNTIFGESAGNGGVAGNNNSSFGAHSLETLTIGDNNAMFGEGAGATLTIASDCVGVGVGSFGAGATSPSRSIGIGSGTLENCDGSYNVAVGYNGGSNYAASESSNILINNTGTASESHTLRIGAGTGTSDQELSAAYICGIDGVNVGSSTVRVVTENSNQLGTADITAGPGITVTPSANAITIEVTGGLAITQIDGDIGSVAGNTVSFNATPVSGSSVQFSGTISTMLLEVTDGDGNTIIGNNAGNGTLTGNSNTGLGAGSFLGLTTGSTNTAVGFDAALSVTTGSSNVAVGYGALGLATTGSENVAIGKAALGDLVSGARCTVVGYGALVATTGSDNIGIGHGVGTTLTTGTFNIYIGDVDAASSSESNTTRIGNDGHTTATYIYGIGGVDVGSVANIVTEDNDQLGTAVLSAGTNISITAGANIITISSDSAVVNNYVTVNNAASPYTALSTDYYISADVTAGTVTIRLPNAPTTGRTFIIKDKVGLAATNNVTVTTVGGAVTIDGSTSFVMNTAYEAISVIFNGTSYEVF